MKYAIYNKNIPLPENKVYEGLFDEVMAHLMNEFGDTSATLVNQTMQIVSMGE